MSLSFDDISYLNASGVSWGACYSYNENGGVDCSHKKEFSCSGYFQKGITCDTTLLSSFNKYETNFWIADKITTASLSGIQIGSDFQGGVYGGTYSPSNISFEDGISTISSSDTTVYAMIIYPNALKTKYLKPNRSLITNTSNFNGRLNLVMGNSTQPSLNFDNIFKDWYFPSIGELYYIKNLYAKNMKFRTKMKKSLKGKFNIPSSSVFNIPSPTILQSRSPLKGKYLYVIDMDYDGNLSLINPNIEYGFLPIRTIEVL